ncbi:MAG: zinc-ribbon domain-containing protein [Eubacteriales bacterium]|nr:zinc-ribbon domain-containing protein [Eubacteriales bacterium]
MFCPNCGTRLSDNAKFCSNCGNKIEEQIVSEPEPEDRQKSEVNQTPEYIPETVTEGVPEPAEAQPVIIFTDDRDVSVSETAVAVEDISAVEIIPETEMITEEPAPFTEAAYAKETVPVEAASAVEDQTQPDVANQPPQDLYQQAQPPKPQYDYGQQQPQQQYGQQPQQQYGQQPQQQYGQYQQNRQPPEQQGSYIPPQNQYRPPQQNQYQQPPQYGQYQQQYQAPQQPYGAQYNQPYPNQPMPAQYYGVYTPPVNKTAQLFAIIAMCFVILGVVFLCIPLFNKIDVIIDDIKILIKNDSIVTAVACGLVPLTLIISMILDFIFGIKATSCKRKSGGLQIITLILASFYWILAHDLVENLNFLLGNGEFSVGLTGGAWYFYDTKFINNGLLIAMICCFISLVLQIVKMAVFKSKKQPQMPQNPPPYGYQY